MGQADADVSGIASLMDLASARLGGRALIATDDFFAGKENLLKPGRAIFIADKFTERGKWMDGWESRRKRGPGHDWCIIALGRPGLVRAVLVDTGHFNGNQPEACTVEGAALPTAADEASLTGPGIAWMPLVPQTPLGPDREHVIPSLPGAAGQRFTHVRLNIFPDGGVARFRAFGEVLPDWTAPAKPGDLIDLAAAENAGLVIASNNMHFGSCHNLIMPGRALNMGDGWETRRKRGLKGGEFDWTIVRLGRRGTVSKVEVDTNHFKGNFPESCMIETADAPPQPGTPDGHGKAFQPQDVAWRVLLPRTPLSADTRHFFEEQLDRAAASNPCTHARLSIFPDGGISRLRLLGTVST
ncbi:MAG: allantoicase [Phycisphaerales bacterium]